MKPTIAIMQPYFLPYIGYWQLMKCVDTFVIYDDVQYTKKGWINRNRFLVNNSSRIFTLPLKKDSDFLPIKNRFLSESFKQEKKKIINKFYSAYQKSPFFFEGMELLKEILLCEHLNLFDFILNSINLVKNSLNISTKIIISSNLNIPSDLHGQNKVIEICKCLNANKYINPIGGINLYNRESFKNEGIDIFFQKVTPYVYSQFNDNFVSNLSIIDTLMFEGSGKVKNHLTKMSLI